MEENQKKKDYFLPASIVIAGLLISIALVYSTGQKSTQSARLVDTAAKGNAPGDVLNPAGTKPIASIEKDEHIFGNIDAPVKIITFSDLECPFCKAFHFTMKQVMENYKENIAWIFRNLPLEGLHTKAKKEAEATECAAELGGNDAFWLYLDKVFENTPSNDGLDLSLLPKFAEEIGLDKIKFEQCLQSGRYIAKINKVVENAANLGIRGTPYSVVLSKDNKQSVIPGALPFESVKVIIEEALK